jgi:hypothetical protein
MPVAAAALPVFRKSRRVVIERFLRFFLFDFNLPSWFSIEAAIGRTGSRLGSTRGDATLTRMHPVARGR